MSYSQPPAYQPPQQEPQKQNSGGEPPIWAPWYGIGFIPAIKRFFKKYADFTGRASRGEFWWFILAYTIVFAVVYAVVAIITVSATVSAVNSSADYTAQTSLPAGATAGIAVLQGIVGIVVLGTLVPYLAVIWRRLHDAGYSGAYYFFSLIPLAGPIMLIVFLASQPRPEGQRFDVPR